VFSDIEFSYPQANAEGRVIAQRPGRARQFRETLAPGVTLELVQVPGGSFRMGSLPGQGFPDEEPQHFVQVGSFWLGKTPVTQAQWRSVVGSHRGRFVGLDLPVDSISWVASSLFCQRLSQKSGRRYCLPSEAQWEYACRAGSAAAFAWGPTATSNLANYNGEFRHHAGPCGIYRHTPLPVMSLPPNAFGLYEMHGTLWEWCADAWHEDYRGAPVDDRPWQSEPRPEFRVARGGCWHDIPEVCRSAARLRAKASEGDELMGLRVACWLEEGRGGLD
jgi:formylglycine-generating enzyme required for sulfatase activity